MVDKNRGADKINRLIIFDVEGVLIPKRRYLLFEAARRIGYWSTLKLIVIGLLYEAWMLPLESALKRIFILFQGLAVDDLFQLYKQVPLIPSVEEVFKKLKQTGYRTALISSGLPTLFVEHLAARLGADYAFGLQLETTDNRFTGKISGDVIKHNGKALVLKKIIERERLSPQDCVVVADDRNNLSLFPLCAVRIGYNPDFLVSAKCDFVVKGALSESLPYLTGETTKTCNLGLSRSDFIREAIHIGGVFVPFVCILLDRYLVSSLIFIVTLLYIASELVRLRGTNIPVFSTLTWRAAIKPELYEFITAPIIYAIAIMVSLILFPSPINYASIAILALGDGFATLFGKKFGRTTFPFNKGKQVEGSFFGFLFAFMGALAFVNPTQALIASAIGMLVESLPTPVSDNLTVPIVSGLVLTVIS
ncbi:MAG: HAD-IB family phosphatase [Candidatus Bathyarchaeota archaeon]